MASMNNAFTLLTGAEQQLNKKKKIKKPAANGTPAQASATATTVPPIMQSSAPVSVVPLSTDLVVGVNEACAIFERAAREAKTASDKVKLWKEWTRLANDKTSKLKYVDSDGVNLDFKQVILRCKALEICAESCISAPLNGDKESILAQMLASFLPNENGLCSALASTFLRLSNSLAQDAPDTLGAAQRAVSSLVHAVQSATQQDEAAAEAANPVAAWLSRVSSLDKEIARQHTLLQKLGAANKNVVTRETANTARQLLKLHEEKFDLLQPEAIPVVKPPAGALGACLRSVEELKAVIGTHLKEAESKSMGVAAAVDASSHAAQVPSYKREEEILSTQAVQVSSQIRTLEAQLQSLRSQAAEIDDKRAALAARQQSAWENGNGAGGKGGRILASAASLPPAHYREALALAASLAGLADPNSTAAASPQQLLNVRTAQVNCQVEYVAAVEHLLSVTLGALGEVPAKLAFCRQRIAQASKLAQLGAVAGKILEDSKRQSEEAERLLGDTMRLAEELVATAAQIHADAHKRYDAMLRFNLEKAPVVTAHIRNVDALAAQIQQQYNVVLSNANGTAPAAPAAPAPVPVQVSSTTAPAAYAPLFGAAVTPAASADRSAVALGLHIPTAAIAPQSNGGPVAAPEPVVVVAAAPRPVQTGPPPRQWAKMEAPMAIADAGDNSLPTPAEAFKGPSTSAGTSDPDGFKAAGKKNRRKV